MLGITPETTWPYGGLQRCNQTLRPMLNRLHFREGTVNKQDTAQCYATLAELLRELID